MLLMQIMHTQKEFVRILKWKLLGEYLDLYVPAKLLSAPGLAWQASSKKMKIKLDLLTDIDMLLMVGKGFRGGICHCVY